VNLLNAAIAQTLRYSNFFLTISTNVKPSSDDERDALTTWLLDRYHDLFSTFDAMNGRVLKPAGTYNVNEEAFPPNHKIISVRSQCAVEEGTSQRGQIHMHITLEIAHRYLEQEDGAVGMGNEVGKRNIGVHINVTTLRDFLNARIYMMNIDIDRRPKKVYVNSILLTKGTDNSNKWLTVQYINKDRAKDNDGGVRNLRRDEIEAHDSEKSAARRALLRPDGQETIEVGPSAPRFTRVTTAPPGFIRTTAPAPPGFVRTTAPAAPQFTKTTISPPQFVQTTKK